MKEEQKLIGNVSVQLFEGQTSEEIDTNVMIQSESTSNTVFMVARLLRTIGNTFSDEAEGRKAVYEMVSVVAEQLEPVNVTENK